MNNLISSDGKTIKRFSKYVIIAHWVNTTCVAMLFLSGLPLYSDMFKFVYHLFGSPQNTMLIHRTFAVIFILPVIFVIITDPKSFVSWIKQITSWKSYDIKFLTEFSKEFFGGHADIPKQGFLNGGQKVNSLLVIFCVTLLVSSGLIIWFKEFFPKELVLWCYPAHDLGVGLMIAAVLGHIYLSVGNPASRPSFKGMTKGYVDTDYAKEHHGRWYDEVAKEENKK